MEYILKKEILAPIIIIFICVIVCSISRSIVNKIFKIRKVNGVKKTITNLISNVIRVIVIILGILTILEVYGIDTKSLIASFGIAGLVAGLALQDVLKDFIVGASIIFEGQFKIGDWVNIDGFIGEIIPSNLRTTKMRAISGEIKTIANRNITEIINYSSADYMVYTDIDVAYESDIEKVKSVIKELCIELKQKYTLKDIENLGVEELTNNSVRFRIQIIIDYGKKFEMERTLKEEILKVFAKNNIVIPYNQVVVHNG